MTIRYIVRPAGIRTTPLALKTALNAERTVRYPGSSRRLLSWERDFFLTYPPVEMIPDARQSESYRRLQSFAVRTKPQQRQILHAMGFPIPATFTGSSLEPDDTEMGDGLLRRRWIARPLRHSGGNGFRTVTPEELQTPGAYNPSTEYLQELYPKTHEYRILIVRGEPLITLLKRVNDDAPYDAPWNHAQGASFVTVEDMANNRLRHTDVYDVIRNNQAFFSSVDLGGLDVMFNRNDRSYRICELNLCPAISIASNLERIAHHVSSLSR